MIAHKHTVYYDAEYDEIFVVNDHILAESLSGVFVLSPMMLHLRVKSGRVVELGEL